MHEVEGLRTKNKELTELVKNEMHSKFSETMRRKEFELQEQVTTLKQEVRVNDQVIIKMQLQNEQMLEEKRQLMEELVKTKKMTQVTKDELSKAKLDQSMSIEELLKNNVNNLQRVLGNMGRGGATRGITGPVDMQSRFMDFNKIKDKYGQKRLTLMDSNRTQ